MSGHLIFLVDGSKSSDFLADELGQIFINGQNSNAMNSAVANKLTGDDYDVGLSLLGKIS